ncbi:MAG: acyl-homoserine-lactone synthase [Xanthobacteraceae bacterium]|jgi:N-acyl-L-homoserine lactone synthetase|uniref:acyl-homoserine-lactone synthase n=1 Tax=Pseudolabrys sp. TaxID=1960880 RepID=UPI003D0F90BF
MFLVLNGRQRREKADYFERIFTLRRQVFIEGRGWSLPCSNGCEIDQYDDENAFYFIDLTDDGEIQGSVRMTPTVKSSLMADYFPHLVENGLPPRSPTIYEATRYIVLPTRKTRENNRIAKVRLLTGLMEWCLSMQLTYLQTVIDSGTLSSFVEITPRTIPLGLSHPYGGGKGVPGGGECMGFRWPITEQVLQDIRDYGARTVRVPRLSPQPALAVAAAVH